MKNFAFSFPFAMAILFVWPTDANAGIVINLGMGSGTTFFRDSVSSPLFVTITSSLPGGENVDGLDVPVSLGAGNGTSGTFATAIITTANAPFFTGSDTSAFVNFDTTSQLFVTGNFGSPKLVDGSPQSVFQYTIDTTGLADGDYTLFAIEGMGNLGAFAGQTELPISVIAGSGNFTVTSVPEPSSIAMVIVIGGAMGFLRRRRKANQSE